MSLGALGFYGQIISKATCGSTPLKNAILGLILMGVSLGFVAGTMFFTDKSIMNTQVFVAMLFIIGGTTLGLAGVIKKNSALKCENDVVCKKTIGDGPNQSKAGTEPCKRTDIVADIAIAIGTLLLGASLVYVYTVYDEHKRNEAEKLGSTSSGGDDSSPPLRPRAATAMPKKSGS